MNWEEHELRILHEEYAARTPIRELSRKLGRSEDSVKCMARILGIAREGHKEWSVEDEEYLRQHYANDGLNALVKRLGRSKLAIKTRAAKLGLEKTAEGIYNSIAETGEYGCPGVKMLTEFELGYIAGLFDGEGCVSASIVRDRYTSLQLCIANTFKPLIEWIHDKLGGIIVEDANRLRPCYWWYLKNGRSVIEFLEVITPRLMVKKAQATIAMTWRPRMDLESTLRLVREIQALNRPNKRQQAEE